jgi:hypothetical protein
VRALYSFDFLVRNKISSGLSWCDVLERLRGIISNRLRLMRCNADEVFNR